MTQGLRLRAGQTGPVLSGNDGDMMQYDAVQELWFPVPGGTPGGSITPLTGVAVADEGGTSDAPDGSWSGAQAFRSSAALKDAIAALGATGGGSVPLAPGTYSGDDAPLLIQELAVTLRGMGGLGVAPPAGVLIIGNITLNASDALCQLRLETLTSNAEISDGGTGADVILDRASSADITITGTLTTLSSSTSGTIACSAANLKDSTIGGDFHANGSPSLYQNTTFSAAFRSEGVSVCRDCTFAGSVRFDDPVTMSGCTLTDSADTMLFLGSGVHVRDSNFAGSVNCENDGDFFNCDFAKSVSASTALVFRQCRPTNEVATFAAPSCSMDRATETAGLKLGCAWSTDITSLDGDGNAAVIAGSATVDFTGSTRRYIPRNQTSVATTLSLTGAIGLQIFTIDTYSTDAQTVLFGVVPIGPDGGDLPAQASGTGRRHEFQVSDDVTTIVYVGSRKL